jgi:hypothetical protein
MRVLQESQLIAEKLLSITNFLNEIGSPHPGQQAFWFLDIGFGLLTSTKLGAGA